MRGTTALAFGFFWLAFACSAAKAQLPATGIHLKQLAKLAASDGAASDELGTSVAVSGDTVVVGAPDDTIGTNPAQGAVYVFVKPASSWGNLTQVARLTASNGAAHDNLGLSVAISGSTVVAGAPNKEGGIGACYVFVKPAAGWADGTENAELLPSDGTGFDGFGSSVSVSGNSVAAGAPNGSIDRGAAYVFVRPANGWHNMTQTSKLTLSDGSPLDYFGSSVAISGNAVVAGAKQYPHGTGPGASFVFVKPAAGWGGDLTQTAVLAASDCLNSQCSLGSSVSIFASVVVAGAPAATVRGVQAAGAAYVFVEPPGGWSNMTQTSKLTASDSQPDIALGSSVSISGNKVVAGAPGAPVGYLNQGSAYLFIKPAGGWANATQAAELRADDAADGDFLGYSVSVSQTTNEVTIVAGSPFETVGSNAYQGAAYVFGPCMRQTEVSRQALEVSR